MTFMTPPNVVETKRITIAKVSWIEMATDGFTIAVTKPSMQNNPAKFSLYAYRDILAYAGHHWQEIILDPAAPESMKERVSANGAKRLSEPVYLAWAELLEAAPTQSRLVQAGFLSSLGRPLPPEAVAPDSDIWQAKILADRHAARLIYAASRIPAGRFDTEWRAFLDPQGTSYSALNKTLDTLPTGIAAKALAHLRERERLPNALHSRDQILAYCHATNPTLGHLIATAPADSMRKALALYNPNGTPRQNARLPGATIQGAVEHMQDELNQRTGDPYHNDTPAAIMRRAVNNDRLGRWAEIRNRKEYPGDDFQFERQSTWPIPEGMTYLNTPQQLIDTSLREHHCVAGYWQQASRGEIEIYQARHAGTTSTIGIKVETNRIFQNRGTNNAFTPASAWANKVLAPLLAGRQPTPTPAPTATVITAGAAAAAWAENPPFDAAACKPASRKPKNKRHDWRNPHRPEVQADFCQQGYEDGQTGKPVAATYNEDYVTCYAEGYRQHPTYQVTMAKLETWLETKEVGSKTYKANRPSAQRQPGRWICLYMLEAEQGQTYFTGQRSNKRTKNPFSSTEQAMAKARARANEPIDVEGVSEEYAAAYLEALRATDIYHQTITQLQEWGGTDSNHLCNPASVQAWHDWENGAYQIPYPELNADDIPF